MGKCLLCGCLVCAEQQPPRTAAARKKSASQHAAASPRLVGRSLFRFLACCRKGSRGRTRTESRAQSAASLRRRRSSNKKRRCSAAVRGAARASSASPRFLLLGSGPAVPTFLTIQSTVQRETQSYRRTYRADQRHKRPQRALPGGGREAWPRERRMRSECLFFQSSWQGPAATPSFEDSLLAWAVAIADPLFEDTSSPESMSEAEDPSHRAVPASPSSEGAPRQRRGASSHRGTSEDQRNITRQLSCEDKRKVCAPEGDSVWRPRIRLELAASG